MTKIVEQAATYLSEYNSNIRHIGFVLKENWVLMKKYPGSSASERCFEMADFSNFRFASNKGRPGYMQVKEWR